jgi:hypothetical protein
MDEQLIDEQLSSNPLFSPENKIKILLAEYQAIEQMHAHYDILNMSMTAIITAGILTLWGIVIQTAFQANSPLDSQVFVNSISVLALTLFFVLSIWIRYTTIHRCIVIQKLNRSHEIENILKMKQNLIFRYNAERFRAPIDSDNAKRRPGGHTLELFLYLSLSTIGGIIAFIFQCHVWANWAFTSYIIVGSLVISPFMTILWMSFCKFDVITTIKGRVEVGFPWNFLFIFVIPINNFLRRLINFHTRQF